MHLRPLFLPCVVFRSFLLVSLDVYYVPGNGVLMMPKQLPSQRLHYGRVQGSDFQAKTLRWEVRAGVSVGHRGW